MSLRILLTRPREDSELLADLLHGHGIETVIEPMMEIVPTETIPDFIGVQAVLLTSANGARVLADKITARNVPVFAVGDATARTAREVGFAEVESASGDVDALAELVHVRLNPDQGALLHPAGTKIAGDLGGMLNEHGFSVRRAVLYETRLSVDMSKSTCELLASGALDAALFFSPRTAQSFVILINQAGLPSACANMDAFCLSAAVAGALEELPWRSVRIADAPETGALLSEIEAWMSQINAGC
ncbi:MAG: uroporphyrinogen-III synthase [Alphaproteobacteria bacterium]